MNNHLTLKQVVPNKVRKKVYLEVIKYYRKGEFTRFRECDTEINTPLNLNMLLPCLLWGLRCWSDESPNGAWDWEDTEIAFPEIKVIQRKLKKVNDPDIKNKIKIRELKNILDEL